MIRSALLLLVSFFAFTACEQQRDPCLEPKLVSLKIAALRVLPDSSFTDTLVPKPYWTALADSPFTIAFPPRSNRFGLILSPHTDSCRYLFYPDSLTSLPDTVTFLYNRELEFLSNACGFTWFFQLKDIRTTRRHLDSARIIDAEVNQNSSTPEHVQIYM